MLGRPHITSHVPQSDMRALAWLHCSILCTLRGCKSRGAPAGHVERVWSYDTWGPWSHTQSTEIRLLAKWLMWLHHRPATCSPFHMEVGLQKGPVCCTGTDPGTAKGNVKKRQQEQDWNGVSGSGGCQGNSRLTDHVDESFTLISILDCTTTLVIFWNKTALAYVGITFLQDYTLRKVDFVTECSMLWSSHWLPMGWWLRWALYSHTIWPLMVPASMFPCYCGPLFPSCSCVLSINLAQDVSIGLYSLRCLLPHT